ncbi:DNA polymerase IV [Mediterraneibacter glycyrrhizinilyticus]|jgi:DNA polymerase-4|uniref:DNA polymerase IV n=1 Tax=Candidatus Mediterraneibacter faecipullorum TaxID=2838670 RepID=A0A9D2SSZ8_9FIRM|nr:DNA polymerase IV [Mediterraneibacter glycyrrhizinilyticus]MBM6801667.1 DNA polymerase IV [Mediterraneibacter glycyrrhizinilyticus]MDM8209458.1 DNA polymerase IV [Mediterraneibacter glycyrrhizinilyticus]HJC34603.1 DNA polymerase IV [Candidatus Mediterraneibacter faecipullorum]
MAPIIFHIDVNSAYLSWTAVEQLKNGATVDLREIPAIIGGDQKSRHGVVLAKSPAAKRYGIRTGEPVANAFRKCPNLAMYPPDHKMYREKSRRLMEYLRTFTKEIEQVSVDECYMDFTGIAGRYHSPVDGAAEIKDGIRDKFGFTVNIGISTNKLLAKMASDFEKPDRIHTLYPEEIKEKMWPLPIGELYMAGRSSVEVLKKLEINTIGDLAQADLKLIMLHLKSHGKMLWEFANGIGTSVVQSEPDEAKGIGNSTTLSEDAATIEEVTPVFERLAQSVGSRLKKAEKKAGMVSMEIKYYDFRTVSHQIQLDKPSNDPEVLKETACSLFLEVWSGEPVRLLGIRTSKLSDETAPEQLSIFDIELPKEPDEKHKRLKKAMDEINGKFGEGAVMKASLMPKKPHNK